MQKLRVPSLEEDQSSQWVSFRTGWLMGAIFIGVIIAIITCKYNKSAYCILQISLCDYRYLSKALFTNE